MDGTGTPRRRVLSAIGTTGLVLGSAGCVSRLTTLRDDVQTPVGEDVASADFTFDFRSADQSLEITYHGGGTLPANRVSISSRSGTAARWNELGSTAETAEEALSPGDAATLGPSVIHWKAPIDPSSSIKVVYRHPDGSPTTLATFTPPAKTTAPGTTETTTGQGPTAPADFDFFDDFESKQLSQYTLAAGDRDQWGFEEHIDGVSLHVSATKSQEQTALTLKDSVFGWSGEGTIAVDIAVNPAQWNKHGLVLFGSENEQWVTRLALEAEQLRLSNTTDGTVASRPIDLSPTDTCRLRITVVDRSIEVSVGDLTLTYEHDAALPDGVVGLGMGSSTIKRGETWFDNFGVNNR